MGSINGYSVLVTGGGSGIGEAAAAKLAADGANVMICGRTEESSSLRSNASRRALPTARPSPT